MPEVLQRALVPAPVVVVVPPALQPILLKSKFNCERNPAALLPCIYPEVIALSDFAHDTHRATPGVMAGFLLHGSDDCMIDSSLHNPSLSPLIRAILHNQLELPPLEAEKVPAVIERMRAGVDSMCVPLNIPKGFAFSSELEIFPRDFSRAHGMYPTLYYRSFSLFAVPSILHSVLLHNLLPRWEFRIYPGWCSLFTRWAKMCPIRSVFDPDTDFTGASAPSNLHLMVNVPRVYGQKPVETGHWYRGPKPTNPITPDGRSYNPDLKHPHALLAVPLTVLTPPSCSSSFSSSSSTPPSSIQLLFGDVRLFEPPMDTDALVDLHIAIWFAILAEIIATVVRAPESNDACLAWVHSCPRAGMIAFDPSGIIAHCSTLKN
jgi:hypothetical protein